MMGLLDRFFRKKGRVSLDKAAIAAFQKIFNASRHSADFVKEAFERHHRMSMDKGTHCRLLCECIFFYIHWTDRRALDLLGARRRVIFMNNLAEVAVNATAQAYSDGRARLDWRPFFLAQLDRANVDYASDTIPDITGGPPYFTLGRKINKIIELETDRPFPIMLTVLEQIQQLGIEEILCAIDWQPENVEG